MVGVRQRHVAGLRIQHRFRNGERHLGRHGRGRCDGECGVRPEGLAFDAATSQVFVANYGSGNVSIISDRTDTVVGSVGVGETPTPVVYDGGSAQVFVGDTADEELSVISDQTDAVVTTIPLGVCSPLALEYDPGAREVFGTCSEFNAVLAVSDSSDSVVAQVGVGSGPSVGLGYNDRAGAIVVTNSHSDNVSFVNDTSDTVVGTVAVGASPSDAAYDASTGELYVSNALGGTISIVTPGAPPGPSISSFSVNPTTASARSPVTFSAAVSGGAHPLSFRYTGLPPGCTSSNSSSLTCVPVAGGSFTVRIYANDTFGSTATATTTLVVRALFGVTFAETGLPSATPWYLNVSGHPSIESSSDSAGLSLTNGTYSYTLQTADPRYAPVVGSSEFEVKGAAVEANASFALATYAVAFDESGLPDATTWSVTFNGTTDRSTQSSLTFASPDGEFAYNVGAVPGYTVKPAAGSVLVNGMGRSIPLVFSHVGPLYAVTFTATGLPAGTNWSVTLPGSPHSSTAPSLTFTEPNGTYAFSVGHVGGFQFGPGEGTVIVSGADRSLEIVASPFTFPVQITETGLPYGTSWTVLVVLHAESSVTNEIVFNLPNGSYLLTVGVQPGYTADPESAKFLVNGSSVTLTVGFTAAQGASQGGDRGGLLGLTGVDGYLLNRDRRDSGTCWDHVLSPKQGVAPFSRSGPGRPRWPRGRARSPAPVGTPPPMHEGATGPGAEALPRPPGGHDIPGDRTNG